MSVVLERSGTVVLAIPRTGSFWAAHAVAASGVPFRFEGEHHALPSLFPGRPAITFVRHPLTWLRSVFTVQQAEAARLARSGRDGLRSSGWPGWPVPPPGAVTPAGQWVQGVLERPGCAGEFFARWTPPGTLVGRYEHRVADLVALLRRAGEDPDEAAVAAAAAVRVSPGPDRRGWAGGPSWEWPPAVAAAIRETERDLITRYYADT